MDDLTKIDPLIGELIDEEKLRINKDLCLIPSENYASKAVLEALGSVLTNKYSEGYPKKRYYGGNEVIDKIEELAIKRAKRIFNSDHVNVQPYSGSPANLEVYNAVLENKDPVMGMKLDQGGHLTHGHKINFSGKNYNFISYGVDEKTKLMDYDKIRSLAKESKPKLIVSGFSAYPRKLDFKIFKEISEEVGAISMADISHISGLVASGEHDSPLPFTDIVTTTTHKTLRGPRAAMIMCKEEFKEAIDKSVFPGMQGGPHNNNISAIAVCLKEAQNDLFKVYCKQIIKNAKTLAETLIEEGIDVLTNGTDNHLILIDLTSKKLGGKEVEKSFEDISITLNKNMIPFDKRSPFDPSGIRIGTPAVTTRGMKESEMKEIGKIIAELIKNIDDNSKKEKLRKEVEELTRNFKIY